MMLPPFSSPGAGLCSLAVCIAVQVCVATASKSTGVVPTVAIRGANNSYVEMPIVGLGSCFGFTPPESTTATYDAVKLWLVRLVSCLPSTRSCMVVTVVPSLAPSSGCAYCKKKARTCPMLPACPAPVMMRYGSMVRRC